MKDQIQLLIDVLLDKTAREDERGDAAIDLRTHKDIRALDALIKIASDPDEDDVIVDNCAESIGHLYVAMNFFNEDAFMNMLPFSQRIVFFFIMTHSPKLINQPLRTELIEKFAYHS